MNIATLLLALVTLSAFIFFWPAGIPLLILLIIIIRSEMRAKKNIAKEPKP